MLPDSKSLAQFSMQLDRFKQKLAENRMFSKYTDRQLRNVKDTDG